ncbi:hypothetical protein SAMN05421504_107330 [Amycolatopsis xylanica]|uniref:Uncharacterized protein n=1 Tax=Amycolatopsis xylanica TaxID=589385 RepID=A0A1H3NJ87_9PSEU|nr:hypothetical protein [Amycolatopsis xylanica]SDY88996.1 hypothetical protein SAMN05421504_107330 [Amycolatopsis xylanica]
MNRILLRSRSGVAALVIVVALWGLSAAIGRWTIIVDLNRTGLDNRMPAAELCAIVGATLLAMLTRPRFWSWDRVGTWRARVVAGVVAAAGIGLPAVCVPVVVPGLPDGTPWLWVLANALVLGALVQLVSPLLSPLAAGVFVLVMWFVCGVVNNVTPGIWLPIAGYREADGRWIAAGVLGVAAIVVHVRTCGITSWAYRRYDKEEG